MSTLNPVDRHIVRLYALGWSYDAIANELGVNHKRIGAATRKADVQSRKRVHPTPDVDLIRELYIDRRYSIGEVALLDMSLRAVGRVVDTFPSVSRKAGKDRRVDLEVVRRMYDDEHRTVADIAARIGVSERFIFQHLGPAGVANVSRVVEARRRPRESAEAL